MMAAYQCPVCDYVYDEAKGDVREGFPPGTTWEDIPDDWCCPDCSVREKIDFETTSGDDAERRDEVGVPPACGGEPDNWIGVSR